jgi:RNA polymerase sigma-70 factor (ECF subfamily)
VSMAPDEVSLVSLVHSGDEDAFASILELYEIPVQRYLFRLTGDYELARDLTQDTFIQAYRYILKPDPAISSLKAWLYGIAVNNARNHFRRRKIVSFIPFSGLKKPEPAVRDGTDEMERSTAIESSLLGVSEEQRVCLVLHFVEGFKYREIAEILGITEEAVRKRVARGSREFRRLYSAGGDGR